MIAGARKKPVIGVAAWKRRITVLETAMDIFQIDEAYVERVVKANAIPVLLPHVPSQDVKPLLGGLDGLLLTGGDDVDPQSYGALDQGVSLDCSAVADAKEMELVRAAIESGLAVLGICRGVQIINVAHGGTLHQEITLEGRANHPPRPGKLSEILAQRHEVEIEQGSYLSKLLGPSEKFVNTTHHQAIKEIGHGFRAVAWAPDGTIEALESASSTASAECQVLGVQWHPEKLPFPSHQVLFDDLAERAARAGPK